MKFIKSISTMAIAFGLLTSLVSCKKDNDDTDTTTPNQNPLSNYVLTGEKTINTADVKLYFGESPFVGYNSVAIELMAPGTKNEIENAKVSFLPMMDMGTMKHSAPFENPTFNIDMDAYMGSSTFIMPSGSMGSWQFSVIIEHEGNADTATFDIVVDPKPEARLVSFVSEADNTTKLFVALKEPMDPQIGMNNFELMVYKKASMMDFPAVTDYTIEIDPEMPTMGHGSPNNVNPVHVENGLYQGTVNFTMSGYWKVNFVIKNSQGVTVKSDGYFDITFQ